MNKPFVDKRRRGPVALPLTERLEAARQRRAWTTTPEWFRQFNISLERELRSCSSYPGFTADQAGGVWIIGRVPQATLDGGYRTISLNYTQQFVHRLMCLAWHGLPNDPSALVLHIDGDAANNASVNLRWGTPAENMDDRWRHAAERGPSPNRERRASSGKIGPQRRQGDAQAFLARLRLADAPANVRPVPDEQGLFCTVDGEVWQVSKPSMEVTKHGYHRCAVTPHDDGHDTTRLIRVHQLVADAHHGPALGRIVRHLDGNPSNNSAGNLVYGTMAENAADRAKHGRTQKGETHAHAKLSDDAVLQIRCAYASGEKVVAIAKRHGVSAGAVSVIATGKQRASGPGPISEPRGNPDGEDSPHASIDTATAAAIWEDLRQRARLAQDMSAAAIAERLGIRATRVARAIRNPSAVSRMDLSDTTKAALQAELDRYNAGDAPAYRIDAIATRHGTTVEVVNGIARGGSWSSVTGGAAIRTGRRRIAIQPRSRTDTSPQVEALLFEMLKQQRDIELELKALKSVEIGRRLGLTKSQVDDVSSAKRSLESLPVAPATKAALAQALRDRARLQTMLPTREAIARATGLTKSFVKSVSAGHAWRDKAARYGYRPND